MPTAFASAAGGGSWLDVDGGSPSSAARRLTYSSSVILPSSNSASKSLMVAIVGAVVHNFGGAAVPPLGGYDSERSRRLGSSQCGDPTEQSYHCGKASSAGDHCMASACCFCSVYGTRGKVRSPCVSGTVFALYVCALTER